jgi:hypothetical protein
MVTNVSEDASASIFATEIEFITTFILKSQRTDSIKTPVSLCQSPEDHNLKQGLINPRSSFFNTYSAMLSFLIGIDDIPL